MTRWTTVVASTDEPEAGGPKVARGDGPSDGRGRVGDSNMGEDGAASSGDADAGVEKTCERCGTAIETSDWYPIAAEREADGSLDLYPFCSENCRDAWREERQG